MRIAGKKYHDSNIYLINDKQANDMQCNENV